MNIQRGFTLLELMVTVTVAGVILAVGVPSFRAIIMDNRMATQANEFVTAVKLARSSAVRFQRNATICVTADHTVLVPTCAASTDWSTGWIVWVDKDRDGATDANEIMGAYEPLAAASTFTSTAASAFSYDARGFGSSAADTLTLCDNRTGETGRLIRVNNVGRTSIEQQGC